MKRIIQALIWCMLAVVAYPQVLSKKLENAVRTLEADAQLKYGQVGLYVVEQQTGKVVVNLNGRVGLVPASTQKVITAASAFELFGSNYKYQTELSYDGRIEDSVLNGNLYIMGYGDPTLGSGRYNNTTERVVLDKWMDAIKTAGIQKVDGDVICFDKAWESQSLPGGWIWDDIGNYYGAGAGAINWSENSYDIFLKSGANEGDKVSVVSYSSKPVGVTITNELTTGKQGSGDNAWIYLPPYSTYGFIRGSIPPNQTAFKISGSFPNPSIQLQAVVKEELKKQNILVSGLSSKTTDTSPLLTPLYTHYSPAMENIIYWLFRKSINLYAEALVKTIGFSKKASGSTTAGISVIKNLWKNKGVDPDAMNMNDGSGLSPLDRVTPEALVKVMQYAKGQQWYPSFYKALPEFNGMKMKSGTMSGVKSFTGYTNHYTFAIIVNNYSGSSSEITRKIYAVLDTLK